MSALLAASLGRLRRTHFFLFPNGFISHISLYIYNINTLQYTAGKVHGSLARAGKVRGQTPKVAPQEKAKKPTGRACKRMKYNRRFVNVVTGMGKKRGPNSQ
jgi:small subunit ribosomal protein S30e